MRSLALLGVLATSQAAADPKPDPWDGHASGMDGTPIAPSDPHAPNRGAPAYGGGWAAGQVITPPAIGDARDWPRGMVIRPPHTGDERAWPNGIWLVPDLGATNWLRGFAYGLEDGLGMLGKLFAP